jgi:hypothetical protein
LARFTASVFVLLLFATAAFAQTATVRKEAPIYLQPNPPARLAPLRVAAAGTVLTVLDEEKGWVQVQFQDPQWGLRTGWVRSELVTIRRADSQPTAPSAKPGQRRPGDITGQAAPRPRTAATAKPKRAPIGLRGLVGFGTTTFSATQTFKAVTGQGSGQGPGGGVEVLNLWRHLFVTFTISQVRLTGERVFVVNGAIYQMGIPVTITMRPIDLAAGWRPTPSRRLKRLEPFVGAGTTLMSYDETSSFAASGEDVGTRKAGFLVLGGADVTVLRWLRVGGEVRYRAVSGILGSAGVSQVYGEKSVGGLSAGLRISLGK